jgi:hypothetical protein
MACRVVADCLVILTMKVDLSISKIMLKYILGISSFHVYNVVKGTCSPSAEVLSDFDGVREQKNREQV